MKLDVFKEFLDEDQFEMLMKWNKQSEYNFYKQDKEGNYNIKNLPTTNFFKLYEYCIKNCNLFKALDNNYRLNNSVSISTLYKRLKDYYNIIKKTEGET